MSFEHLGFIPNEADEARLEDSYSDNFPTLFFPRIEGDHNLQIRKCSECDKPTYHTSLILVPMMQDGTPTQARFINVCIKCGNTSIKAEPKTKSKE